VGLQQPDSQRKGISLMRDVIANDPGNSAAYAALALTYARSAHSPFPLPDALTIGKAAADNAIRLDSTAADAWAALGILKMYLEWDWPGAEKAMKRAIDLNPSFAEVRWHYGYYLLLWDRADEAIVQAQQAHDLDPFAAVFISDLANLYTMRGQPDVGIKLAREALRLPARASEGYGAAWSALALGLVRQGKFREGIEAADTSRKLSPGNSTDLVYVLVQGGQMDSAKAVLAAYERSPVTPIGAVNRAIMHGMVGDNDGFFQWIRYEPHHAWLPWIRVLPFFTPPSVRRDPRFQAEMRRMHLPMPRE